MEDGINQTLNMGHKQETEAKSHTEGEVKGEEAE